MKPPRAAAGALHGKLIQHTAALAATVMVEDRVPFHVAHAPLEIAAVYERGTGLLPFRVVRDTTVNRPYGRHAVYIGTRRLGAQLSMPSADDCRRMEEPPPAPTPIEDRLDARARTAHAMGDACAHRLNTGAPGERIRGADSARLRRERQGPYVRLVNGQRVKRCSGCKADVPLEQFNLGSGPGGYHRHCRNCCKAAHARREAKRARGA